MRFMGQSRAVVSAGFGPERTLLVRKVLSWVVYYNNGNSLPVFSIPSCWETSARSGDLRVRNHSIHSSRAANKAIGILFGGNDLCAPHLLQAGLCFSSRAKSEQGRWHFALHSQDVKSRGKTVTRSNSDTLKS